MGGFGHIKPAQALNEQFTKLGLQSRIYDPASLDGSPVHESANVYNFLTRSPILSPIWNLATRHDLLPAWVFQPIHWLEVFLNRSKIKHLRQVITEPNKTIFTATHFTPALWAATAFPKQTIFLYVTDIHPHGLWKVNPKNIHYLVPMEETKIDLLRYGIPNERISITSFPIHKEIIQGNTTRFKHRLSVLKRRNPRRIDVLVISGGAGTGRKEMRRLIQKFVHPAKTKQVRLTFLVSTPNLEIDLISYCAQIETHKDEIFVDRYSPSSLYKALIKAEILITKAGGDITFEALAEGLAIYTLKDVGDHERLNRQYLELIGASKPLFLSHEPWQLILSDILNGDILLLTKASHKAGELHRKPMVPLKVLEVLEPKPKSL